VTDRLKAVPKIKPDGTKHVFWEGQEASVVGRSGGPLIDRRGNLVGVCSGKSGGKGYYVHLDYVYEALDREGLTWVYADEPKNAK